MDRRLAGDDAADLSNAEMVAPALVGAAFAFLFIIFLHGKLMAYPVGKDLVAKRGGMGKKLDHLSKQIKDGARAFLLEEYKWLALFVLLMAVLLVVVFTAAPDSEADNTQGVRMAAAFIMGASLSAAAGWLGMMVATDGNVRTTVACADKSLNDGLQVAFTTGAIMGFTVVGLGLGGLSCAFLLFSIGYDYGPSMQVLAGFGFGASSIALFARVAGGIYTKAADVGADLVGKVENDVDEDDPHNPAVIADNVGDNVGDVAGMGADLFESYVGSVIAAVTLATTDAEKALPFWLSGAGILCSILGYFFVSTSESGGGWNTNLGSLMFALEKGMYSAGILFLCCAALCCWLLGSEDEGLWGNLACIIIGLIAGMLIGKVTEYFTSFDFAPVKSITNRGKTGPATVIIQGIGVGMISCAPPVIILVATILACAEVNGNYGVAIAAVGMLATLGITLATDAYGPVADNAGGLAEMDPTIPEEVRSKTDALDALGNTTAATGKGFAIGSAVLTSLSLLAAFKNQANLSDGDLNVGDPVVLSGLLFGAMLPYMFAALTMISVGKAAAEIILEVRRQFREVPGLKEALLKASSGIPIPEGEDVLPESDKCVAISTRSSVREMIAPGLYAILAPLFVGFMVGPRCLMGMLCGSIGSGCMVAIMMSNAGGAWDNGKKLCEKLNIKKTAQGKACIVGDTVGDPFKDTSGPALNILLKLMSMVSLTMAPLMKVTKNQDSLDWNNWWWGMIPLFIFVVATFALVQYGILTWEDPIANLLDGGGDAGVTNPAVGGSVKKWFEGVPDQVDESTAIELCEKHGVSGFDGAKFGQLKDPDLGTIRKSKFMQVLNKDI